MNKFIKNKLSFAIPTFNGKDTISETINSILRFPNVDIVISDNCSTDSTVDILKKYEANYTNIYINYNNSNIGFRDNLLKCISLCKTDYVWLLSDDDIVRDNAVNIFYSIVNKNDYGLIFIDNLKEYSGFENSKDGNDPNDFFKLTKFRSGGLSSNIINRNLWFKIDYKKYPPEWPHLIYAIKILTQSSYFIYGKSLKYEIESTKEKRWLANAGLFPYLYSLHKTYKVMNEFSCYNKNSISAAKSVISKHILTAIIVNKKYSLNFDLKAILFILFHSRKYFVINIFMLITPYSFIKKITNYIKISFNRSKFFLNLLQRLDH